MLTFVVRRLLLAVPVLLGVVFVVMLTIDLLPGDAVTLMLGEHATQDAVARLREHLGLDKPFVVRYLEYVGRVARGDLGRSERLSSEREALTRELSRAFGLGGRARRSGSAVERARVAVQRRVREVVRRIAEQDAALGEHLDRAIRTGTTCAYRPSLHEH